MKVLSIVVSVLFNGTLLTGAEQFPEQFLPPDSVMKSGLSLNVATLRGDVETVQAFLSAGADPDEKSECGGWTPLLLAAFRGDKEILEHLLAARANINLSDDHGKTPLHWALLRGHTELADILIQTTEINLNQADEDGRTPLHIAAQWGYTELIQKLITAGADANLTERWEHCSPFNVAIQWGHSKAAKILRRHMKKKRV
ncbi:MAG: ankyrin repeat domain-containing protein [Deltaproteobacteria bacterium]|nr:ankyrin repeat domain-containing protein [Deltaproteobacteria bacterium]